MSEPSTSQNHHHHHLTTTTTTATTTVPWGTLEELLLACAVHRYGTTSWDSIAKELQTRTSLSHFTPLLCQQKYRDLKRRFAEDENGNGNGNDAVLCLDELRRLRVAELRRELHRYDLSIVSLQLKVKKLKEETDNNNNNNNDNNNKENENENEKEVVINDVIKEEKVEEMKEEEKVDLQKNEQNNNNKKEEIIEEVEKKEEAEGDTWNSAESTRSNNQKEVVVEDEVKESSDVQSTVNGSDGNKEKKVGVVSGTSSGDGDGDGKENPTLAFTEFLEVVRGRKLLSFFERRLLIQETPKYNNLIKQHIDLETIQSRLEEGQYTECQTKFYRDVMLLINNAIIFFGKRSPENKAALELRHLLNKQFQTHVSMPHDQKSQPSKFIQPTPLPKPAKPEPNQFADLKQPKLTITGPVIACRKRSSIAGKSSRGERKETMLVTLSSEKLSSFGEKVKQQGEKTSSTSFNAVTKKRTGDQSFGSRSSSSKSNRNLSPSTPITGKGENSEAKADKNKQSPGKSLNKMRQGSGSGTNRGKGTLLFESLKNSDKPKTGTVFSGSKLVKEKDKAKEERDNTLSKEKAKRKEDQESSGNRSNRRPPKRAAAIAAMGKRGRDSAGKSESQSKKRQRK